MCLFRRFSTLRHCNISEITATFLQGMASLATLYVVCSSLRDIWSALT
jgi:hypothetical protein